MKRKEQMMVAPFKVPVFVIGFMFDLTTLTDANRAAVSDLYIMTNCW